MTNSRFKVVHVDSGYFPPTEIEYAELAKVGAELVLADCKSEDDMIRAAKDVDAVLDAQIQITRRVIESLDRCKVIARYGIGVDTIDVPAATERGIIVTNVPDYCVEEVANHAIAFLLACAKKIVLLDRHMRQGKWPRDLLAPMVEIHGQTLGLVGFGRIARATATRAKAFGLDVIVYDPYLTEDSAREHGVRLVSFDELLKESDFVSIHVPLTEETRHMFGRSEFRKMKESAFLINVARGPVVDEEALIEAIKGGEIAGAGLDVFEKEPLDACSELLTLDDVVLTPHSAFYSDAAYRELRRRTVFEVARVLSGQWPTAFANPEVRGRSRMELGG